MFGLFKKMRAAGGEKPAEVVLGFACGIRNATLGIDVFGSPVEIRESVAGEWGRPLPEVVRHVDSEVSVFRISQKEPLLQWNGGPHAERLMSLMDIVASGDARAVAGFSDVLDPAVDGSHAALIAAAHRGQLDMVEALVAEGASVNTVGALGMTPLLWSSARGHEDVTSALLKAGASDAASNWFCLTPADLAALNDHVGLAQKHFPASHVRRDIDWQGLTVQRMTEL